MDNLTHSLLAGAIARTRLGARSPLSGMALVISANVPDLDSIVQLFGGMPAYLVHHRGITHSIAGLAAQALLLTLLFRRLEVRRARRTGSALSRAGPGIAVAVGLASHLFLDALNVYGVRPLLPFDGTWRYADLCFIVDPWMWLILGAPAVLLGRRTRGGDVAWAVLGASAVLVVLAVPHFVPHAVPLALRVVFPLGVLGIAAARVRGEPSVRPSAALGIAALAFALYLGLLGFGRDLAERRAARLIAQTAPRSRLVASVPWVGDPFAWTVIHGDGERWHAVDLGRGDEPRVRSVPKELDHPVLASIADTREVRAWRVFARTPFLVFVRSEGGALVRLLDLRYVEPDGSSWAELRVWLADAEPR